MILITSAKYVAQELQSEFGKIPPSFLPLGGKRLYEHHAKLFESGKQKIVLSLPQSFVVTKFDQRKLHSLGIQILHIPDEFSLGESIIYALNMNMPINGQLKILHGDTYFDTITNESNSITVTKVDSSYDWTFIFNENGRSDFNLKESNLSNAESLIISGYFNIEKPYDLIQSIVQSKYSFVDGLKLYSEVNPFSIMENNSWLDFGLSSNYFHSKKKVTTERAFNSLSIKDDFVHKSSQMPGKLNGEINWFKSFPKELSLYIPRFYSDDNGLSYKTEYLYQNTLSELLVFGKLPTYIWKIIFIRLKELSKKLHSFQPESKDINFDYKFKTISRLNSFTEQTHIDLDRPWLFNGKPLPSINQIVYDLDSYLASYQCELGFIHGDYCFSNIMYEFKSDRIKVFDPRGVDFNSKITVYGDKNYDYAKLMHSVVGLYDFIISGFYNCKIKDYSISFYLDIDKDILSIQKLFFEVFDFNKEQLFTIMIHLFLSMLPLHNDDKNKQDALLANMFRLYNNLKEGF